MSPFGTFALCIMMGFATSQVLASFLGFVLGQRGPAEFQPRTDLGRVLALCAVTFTGPAVLFESALNARLKGEQPESYLYVSLGIVSAWSFLIGMLIVRLAQVSGIL